MKPMNLKLTVPADRKLTIQLPADSNPGDEIEVTVILHPAGCDPEPDSSLDWFPILNVSRWDPEVSLRRADMYGDSGR